MKSLFSYLLPILMFLAFSQMAQATHNRAGEITYEQIDDLTIRATITTYTKTTSVDADRDSLQIMWGDGSAEFVQRSNGGGVPIDNDIKINLYTTDHTYPGSGTYTISMMDPNRVGNILNVNFPNSVNVPFYIETTFTFLNTQFQGFNNSAILLQAPIDFACANEIFRHNPNAFDPDGDSLSYEFTVPGQDVGMPVPDYSFPDQIDPGIENQLSINPVTGEIIWDAPQIQGEYNIAIRINEFREGVLINSLVRDMQIVVEACDNQPPDITAIDEICVIAGDVINIPILVDDPNAGDLVKLTASGGPFTLSSNAATLEVFPFFSPTILEGNFIWETTCDHVAEQFYQVVFRAVDNFKDTTGLADLKTLRIKVTAPPPLDVTAKSLSDQIQLSWELPYDCEFAEDDYFQGFSVWRKVGSTTIEKDTCNPGLLNTPYEKIIFLTNENDGERYTAIDANVEKGTTYCYRVLGEFARTTAGGNPYNKVQSLTSDEICLQISRDIPLLTNVSVESTSASDGSILARWTKPLADDLDTLRNPGPYRYQLLRAIGLDGVNFDPVPGADFTINSFSESVDTSFVDSGLDTENQIYKYRVDFFSADLTTPFGSAQEASSIFLNVQPRDRANELTWEFEVPWDNIEYTILRFDDITSDFDSVGTTTELSFIDQNLENEIEFCYKVKAIGTYGIASIADPLINFSQEACSIPVDNEGPCPPELQISNICNEDPNQATEDELANRLLWTRPDLVCGDFDLAGYNIYFSQTETGEFSLIETLDGNDNNSLETQPESGLAGCYAVSAFDNLGNEGEFSNTVCVDNCPIYELGNAFTPNGDGSNDLYTPLRNRFISSIEIQIFNRWGGKVFETTDPEINWDGTNLNSKELAEGVYYYSCTVFEERVSGITPSGTILSGFIHLIRG